MSCKCEGIHEINLMEKADISERDVRLATLASRYPLLLCEAGPDAPLEGFAMGSFVCQGLTHGRIVI